MQHTRRGALGSQPASRQAGRQRQPAALWQSVRFCSLSVRFGSLSSVSFACLSVRFAVCQPHLCVHGLDGIQVRRAAGAPARSLSCACAFYCSHYCAFHAATEMNRPLFSLSPLHLAPLQHLLCANRPHRPAAAAKVGGALGLDQLHFHSLQFCGKCGEAGGCTCCCCCCLRLSPQSIRQTEH